MQTHYNECNSAYSSQSTQTNKSRLKLLQAREQHLSDLFTTAREELMNLSKDEGRYSQLLESTITQVSRQARDVSMVLTHLPSRIVSTSTNGT